MQRLDDRDLRVSTLVESLLPGLNSILGIRDALGAGIKEVWFVTRTWSGETIGDGTAVEVRARLLPTPKIVAKNGDGVSKDERFLQGGTVDQADLSLKNISKSSYPNETDVDCSSTLRNVEKFYEVGGKLYQVKSVSESYLTWNVDLRSISNQQRPE